MLIEQNSEINSGYEYSVAIVGAGISGLAAANKLRELSDEKGRKIKITILESSNRVGGVIQTHRFENYVIESGPDSFITKQKDALSLCQRLGLSDHIIQTQKERRTFIAHRGKLQALPDGFFMLTPTKLIPFAKSNLLSWSGKWRALREMFVKPSNNLFDESLAQFITRRFGNELYATIAEPMVSGIYTGDGNKLSAKSALPYFWNLEHTHGSIIRGMQKDNIHNLQNTSGARYGLFVSLDEGLELLPKTILNKLPPDSVRLVTAVKKAKQITSGNKSKWLITLKNAEEIVVDALIIATPAYKAAEILNDNHNNIASYLKKIPYSSTAIVNMVFDRSDIEHRLNGFGFVVPKMEGGAILACSFSSIKFANRVPSDKVLLRVFVGGVLQKDIYELSDIQMECLVWQDLNKYLGVNDLPIYSFINRYPNSMPQYNVGHQEIVASIEAMVRERQGLAVAGNSYNGVGIPNCILSGEQAANSVFCWLESQVVRD
jgi:oxygen-dependent protoporphyrinogen oxidase